MLFLFDEENYRKPDYQKLVQDTQSLMEKQAFLAPLARVAIPAATRILPRVLGIARTAGGATASAIGRTAGGLRAGASNLLRSSGAKGSGNFLDSAVTGMYGLDMAKNFLKSPSQKNKFINKPNIYNRNNPKTIFGLQNINAG